MKQFLLATMVVIGLGSLAACNRDTTPASPNRVNPPSAPPVAQNRPSGAESKTAPGAAGESNTSPRPGEGTESQVASPTFESVDTNKDGVITQNEALAVPGLDFAAADTDKSKTLSRQEFAAAMAKIQQARPGG
jgi:hypothetical protein